MLQKIHSGYHLRFTQAQANVSQQRRRSQIHLTEGRNLRAAVEAAVRQVKHPFPASKLPVRGQFRVSCMVIGSAAMSNIRRIQCFLAAKRKAKSEENEQNRTRKFTQQTACDSFLSFWQPKISYLFKGLIFQRSLLGC